MHAAATTCSTSKAPGMRTRDADDDGGQRVEQRVDEQRQDGVACALCEQQRDEQAVGMRDQWQDRRRAAPLHGYMHTHTSKGGYSRAASRAVCRQGLCPCVCEVVCVCVEHARATSNADATAQDQAGGAASAHRRKRRCSTVLL